MVRDFDAFRQVSDQHPARPGPAKKTAIIDLSHNGDKATDMASGNQYLQLKEIMQGEPKIRLDAILLSAGGNDVIEKVEQIVGRFQGSASQGVERADEGERAARLLAFVGQEVQEVFKDIESSIRRICDLRKDHNRDVPVVIHGYADITPREAPARPFSWAPGVRGPWLKTRLDALGIHDPARQKELGRRVIDLLNDFYRKNLAAPAIHGMNYLDLRPYVIEARLDELTPTVNWNDEIHPGTESLGRISSVAYAPLLNRLFQ